jgi:ATP-dependent DNA helicase
MTKMLDLLESFLDQQGHRVCRIDGSIPWQQRQQNIKHFNEDPDA